jgi:hypothetical protein
MLQTSFPELKKHRPTNLYMLYPMAQSVVLVCVEIDKKMPPQWHCPLSSTLSLLVQPTPQRANKRPYLQGTGATYPHTMKSFGIVPRRVLHRFNRCFEVLTLKLHVEVYGRLLGRSLKGVRTILLSVRVVRVCSKPFYAVI